MRYPVCVLALLFAAPAIFAAPSIQGQATTKSSNAETNFCSVISALPATITQPGVYCLEQDQSISAGVNPIVAITVQASDVVIDCNSHLISGTRATDANMATLNLSGIVLYSSARSTVRNCRISGFIVGIKATRVDNTFPNSRDIAIENNRVEGCGFPISMLAEGYNTITGNQTSGCLGNGMQAFVNKGVALVRDNYISSIGNTAGSVGNAGFFGAGTTDSIMEMDNNVFAEVKAPTGATSYAAVNFQGVGAIHFNGNSITAPANAADKGQTDQAVGIYAGTPVVSCSGNVIVGYGPGTGTPCAAANNRIY
jgi:parallel beta-helix repeat protein